MPKTSPYAIGVPERPVQSRIFTDPALPDVEVEFVAREANCIDMIQIAEVTGTLEAHMEKAGGLLCGDGKLVPVRGNKIANLLAMMDVVQAGPPESRYSPEEMIAWGIRSGVIFSGISMWVMELCGLGEALAALDATETI